MVPELLLQLVKGSMAWTFLCVDVKGVEMALFTLRRCCTYIFDAQEIMLCCSYLFLRNQNKISED